MRFSAGSHPSRGQCLRFWPVIWRRSLPCFLCLGKAGVVPTALARRPVLFRDRLVLVVGNVEAAGDDVHRAPRPPDRAATVYGHVLQPLLVDTIIAGLPVFQKTGLLLPLTLPLLSAPIALVLALTFRRFLPPIPSTPQILEQSGIYDKTRGALPIPRGASPDDRPRGANRPPRLPGDFPLRLRGRARLPGGFPRVLSRLPLGENRSESGAEKFPRGSGDPARGENVRVLGADELPRGDRDSRLEPGDFPLGEKRRGLGKNV
jgi:hypothetical protein